MASVPSHPSRATCFIERTPARVAQRAAEHDVARVDAVDLGVGHGVAVGVALEFGGNTLELDIDLPDVVEELLAGHIDDLAVALVAGVVEPGEQHAARAPRELVAVGIVVGLGRRQTTAVGLEGRDLTALGLDPVDDLHGGHVVDAGVDAELVEEDDSLLLGLGVEGLHVVLDVGGGDHVLAFIEAGPRHLRVELPRQQAHRHVVVGDDRRELVGLDR